MTAWCQTLVRPLAQSRFVYEDDDSSLFSGVFLMPDGHVVMGCPSDSTVTLIYVFTVEPATQQSKITN
jgi:hypothetical protein